MLEGVEQSERERERARPWTTQSLAGNQELTGHKGARARDLLTTHL